MSLSFKILILSVAVINAAPLLMENTEVDMSNCGEIGDCVTVHQNCTKVCGCDNWYYFNNVTNECLLNIKHLQNLTIEKYNTEEILRSNADRVFNGIFVAVYFFLFSASLCAISACAYCCHLNYSDYKLRDDIKALSQKLERDGKLGNPATKPKKKKTEEIAQSCNVVVEDAGVFVC
ncbi:hypothetical protein NE865_12061 [Phthorimaea operculella]|nr:hypothetical protein NE865_12061 [Phthorimaea operculella]